MLANSKDRHQSEAVLVTSENPDRMLDRAVSSAEGLSRRAAGRDRLCKSLSFA